jgi:hypothetical protein
MTLAFVLLPLVSFAQGAESDRAVRAKLDSIQADLSFEDAGFVDAVQFLGEKSGLNILIDSRVSDEVAEATVSLSLKAIRLENALDWLVRGVGLAWKVTDGVVLITSRDAAADRPQLALYDVSDILSAPRDFPAFGTADSTSVTVDDLGDVVRAVVAPETWESSPNSMESTGKSLLVVAEPAVHAQVERLLATLRAASQFTVTFDARVLDLSSTALPGLPTVADLAPGKAILTKEEADSILARAAAEVLVVESARFTCMNGQRIGMRLEHVEDVAGGVRNPDAAAPDRLSRQENDRNSTIEVAPTLLVGKNEFMVDLQARLADERLDPSVVHTPRGRVECPQGSGRAVRTGFRVPNGGAALLVLGSAGDRVRALFVRVSSSAQATSTSTPIEPVKPGDEAAAAGYREFLARKVSLDFSEAEIESVIAHLREVGGMNLLLDPELAGEARDWKVTLKVRDVEMGAALNLIRMMFDVSYVYRDEAVVIARSDRAEDSRVELYDVRDLIRAGRDWAGPNIDTTSDPLLPAVLDAEVEDALTGEMLSDLVQQTLGPGTWDDGERASLRLFNGMLVVLQTPTVHGQLSKFLGELRQARPRQLQVDARILVVEPRVHDALDPGGDGPLPEKSRAELEKALASGNARTVAAWSLLGSNARRFHAVQARHRGYVSAYSQDAGATVPELDVLRGAHVLDIRPTLVPTDPGRIVVELRAACRDLPDALPTAASGPRVVEEARSAKANLATTVVVTSGDMRMFSLGSVAGQKGGLRRVLVWTVRAAE